jgi:hypothetical protein
MKKLDEFNAERHVVYSNFDSNAPVKNGIECPKCGAELLDSSPRYILTSNPPKKNIHCEKCDFTGYRVA